MDRQSLDKFLKCVETLSASFNATQENIAALNKITAALAEVTAAINNTNKQQNINLSNISRGISNSDRSIMPSQPTTIIETPSSKKITNFYAPKAKQIKVSVLLPSYVNYAYYPYYDYKYDYTDY